MTPKKYPNAIFGCGHLSPIGWCGECAINGRIPKLIYGTQEYFHKLKEEYLKFEEMKREARAKGTLLYEDEGSLFIASTDDKSE